jgi:aspartate racemase
MKTLGIIGGMSWESTQIYYSLINQGVKQRLGGLHSAKIILHSVDFAEIEALQATGDWQNAAAILCAIAENLQAAGADAVLVATNTMHKLANEIERVLTIPLLHIADAAGNQLRVDGRHKAALLGTQFTMQESFYTAKLKNDYGLEVLIPSAPQCEIIHQIIYQELCVGQFKRESRRVFCDIIDDLVARGADSIILGCTEIPLLIKPKDTSAPLYDTTELHAQAAVEFALGGY